ncbi:unnamed protein product [Ceutorhynchus assimilis]|uniref:Uncharacterized protein n=1 Tax=Ceutorhynchus assimilis TaxID=467358 RepID=A0A9N9QLE0_9CUCU|nr:unnamed protein product [Ceutorhynchus assimilis]
MSSRTKKILSMIENKSRSVKNEYINKDKTAMPSTEEVPSTEKTCDNSMICDTLTTTHKKSENDTLEDQENFEQILGIAESIHINNGSTIEANGEIQKTDMPSTEDVPSTEKTCDNSMICDTLTTTHKKSENDTLEDQENFEQILGIAESIHINNGSTIEANGEIQKTDMPSTEDVPSTEKTCDNSMICDTLTTTHKKSENDTLEDQENFEQILDKAEFMYIDNGSTIESNGEIQINENPENVIIQGNSFLNLVDFVESDEVNNIINIFNVTEVQSNLETEDDSNIQEPMEIDFEPELHETSRNDSEREDRDYEPEAEQSDEESEEDMEAEEEDMEAANQTPLMHEEASTIGINSYRKRNQNLRVTGQKYVGFRRPRNQKLTFQDVERNARLMGPSCTSAASFWENLPTWEQKKVYVMNLVSKKEKERQRTDAEVSRRNESMFYSLNIGDRNVQVCKKMFLGTLGLKEWMVSNWVNNSTYGTEKTTSKRNSARLVNEESVEFLKSFLDNLPKLPSHYCRKETKKLYLQETFGSFSELHKLYQQHCDSSNQKGLSRNTLMKYVKEKNIGIFSPRKDQCDLCVEYQAGNLEQETWEKHRQDKERAQQEKVKDKEEAKNNNCHVLCMDLQAVKTCPYLQASSLYFKTKLCCHNFTVYDLNTKDATCYWFDETDTDLQASAFASLLVDFLQRKFLNIPGEKKPIIIFSDGCTYQNRNSTMANALLSLSTTYNVTIIQKYLVKGHTNMECDSVHATIEKKLKNKTISVPHDFQRITEEARKNPNPYEVMSPSFDFFKNYNKDLVYESIRPGRKPDDPTVTNIRALKYERGEIHYKLDFNENFLPLPQRPKRSIKKIDEFPRLFTGKLPITKQKFTHLQQIKTKLNSNFWSFYDNLLHK